MVYLTLTLLPIQPYHLKTHHLYTSNFKIKIMQELITRLTQKAGINTEQATKSLETIKEFVKEKFPMLGGAVDNMFAAAPESVAAAAPVAEVPKQEEHSVMDKISDVIPGQAGEKVNCLAVGRRKIAVRSEQICIVIFNVGQE